MGGRDGAHSEPLGREPGSELREITVARAELRRELGWGEPMMVGRGASVGLRGEKLVETGDLRGRLLKTEGQRERLRGRQRSGVDRSIGLYGAWRPGCDRLLLCRGDCGLRERQCGERRERDLAEDTPRRQRGCG